MTSRKNKPVFIALEGGEGAGKSTQAQLLVTRIQQEGRHATLVHEPGTTPLGQHLREYLKSKQKIAPEAELLLFEASRAQLMAEVIQPSLSHGISVIADRFAASSIAYQGYGRRIGGKKVRQFNDFATGGLYPDLNILLNLPPSAGLERTSGPQLALGYEQQENLRQDTEGTRRFEELPDGFHQRVREGYLAQVAEDPERWTMIDGTMPLDQIHEAIWEKILEIMK